MSNSIKELSIQYNAINESNTFTSGDIVEGRVLLEVTKEIKVDSFFVKLTGDANVHWTRGSGDNKKTYSAHERYFKLKQYFIQESSKRGESEKNTTIVEGETYGSVIKPGSHVFPFSFQLPQQSMPPSFKGFHGWVKYGLTVKLSRPWKSASTTFTELNFVLKNEGTNDHLLQPQSGTLDKKIKLFGSGRMSLAVTVEKTGYMQGDRVTSQEPLSKLGTTLQCQLSGETIRVFVDTENSSSRDVKLKYSLRQEQAFIASGSTTRGYNDIVKETRDHIPSGEKSKFVLEMTVPHDLTVTIENCKILKVQYELKVYLDVSFASDPEVKFPLVILPLEQQCPPPPAGPDPSLPDSTALPDPGATAGVYSNPNPDQHSLHSVPSSPDDDPNQSKSSPDVPY